MNISFRAILLVSSLFTFCNPGSVHAQDPAAANAVVHVEILGVDAPALQRFYGELFGWKITLNPIGYGYIPVAPAAPVMLTGGVGASPQRQRLVIFYVKVTDPAATLKRAEALGLGTVYIGALRNRPSEVSAELKLPRNAFPLFGLCIGHCDPSRPSAVKPRLSQACDSASRALFDSDRERGGRRVQRSNGGVPALARHGSRPLV